MSNSLHREVFRLALPSILANITIPLVGIVDTAIAGHISDAAAIGGIAIGTMLFDLLYWNFGFLRVGTAGMTAQAYGEEKTAANGAPSEISANSTAQSPSEISANSTAQSPSSIFANLTAQQTSANKSSQILLQSLTTAFGAALFIWLLQVLFLEVSMYFIPCSEQVAQFATRYFYIRIWAAPATLMLMAFRGWFIGMQNTVATMSIDLVVNLVNMFASWWLAVKTQLGIIGVAYGTVVAQYMGLAVAIGWLILKYKTAVRDLLNLSVIKLSLSWSNIKRLFVLNSNLFVRSLCFMVVYVGFTSLAAKYGDDELAVSSIMMKLFMLFSYFIDGFAYAGEALTGRFIGEKNSEGLIHSVKILFLWTVIVGIICTLLYWFGADRLVALMTNQEQVLILAKNYYLWLILMPLLSCLAFLYDGIFIGATAGADLRNAMILAAVSFVASYLILAPYYGINALYFAYFMHLLARTLYLAIRWMQKSRNLW